ncbi:MAG: Heterodisulfide reductase subunit [Candidatus Hydrogenedentes bacterium]|nr:Heterodisulfide reductase subunit [Candidatus Hydrogenedentota bacterium]
MSDVITQKALLELVGQWIGRGKRVVGPRLAKDDVVYLYAPLESAAALKLDGFIHPQNSIKEFFFPRHEAIYTYQFKGQKIALGDVEVPDMEQVIVGARPCDAASLPVLDKVFNWDSEDTFYTRRRKQTTVISLGCIEYDDQCFCTSVGLGPAAEQGSDVLLLPVDGGYEVRCLTDKGKALFSGKTASLQQSAQTIAGPDKQIDPDAIRAFLKDGFESGVWNGIALRCLGCGASAYTCPTCHCFDIVDEGDANGGQRVKNWDSCQFGMFTLHASGHNPRSQQAHRQRQRILHKFFVYPEKFDAILCTGCGNCTRNCPVSLGVLSALKEIAMASTQTNEAGR